MFEIVICSLTIIVVLQVTMSANNEKNESTVDNRLQQRKRRNVEDEDFTVDQQQSLQPTKKQKVETNNENEQ